MLSDSKSTAKREMPTILKREEIQLKAKLLAILCRIKIDNKESSEKRGRIFSGEIQ